MSGARIQIGKPDDIDRLIAACASLGFVGRVELLRAVRAGAINLAEPPRDAVLPEQVLEQSARPLAVLIGDDDYAATGPTGWAAIPRLLRWATAAMVHATGGDAHSYRMAIGMAVLSGRFVLIETDTAHAREWAVALEVHGIPTLVLQPSEGVHPVPLDRRAVQ